MPKLTICCEEFCRELSTRSALATRFGSKIPRSARAERLVASKDTSWAWIRSFCAKAAAKKLVSESGQLLEIGEAGEGMVSTAKANTPARIETANAKNGQHLPGFQLRWVRQKVRSGAGLRRFMPRTLGFPSGSKLGRACYRWGWMSRRSISVCPDKDVECREKWNRSLRFVRSRLGPCGISASQPDR